MLIKFSIRVKIVGFLIYFLTQTASASTLNDVTYDDSKPVLTGDIILLPGTSGFTFSSLGATLSDGTGNYSVSGTYDGAMGAFDVFSGIPPVSFAGGSIEDASFSSSLMKVLFKDSSTKAFFVAELTGTDLPTSSMLLTPVFGASAEIFAADATVIPLPASGLLLIASIAGCAAFRRMRA